MLLEKIRPNFMVPWGDFNGVRAFNGSIGNLFAGTLKSPKLISDCIFESATFVG